ncbi:SMP-30/gluconolactonase/LRE family protein [Microbulbifer sp. ZKSA004]|uniref:SMP-30/gluconolactonase/LRE family protein n=1 Tax=Microbulbifer sp. ZKSA004 TaxID=3243389 RepID=UPI00403A2C6D
MTTKSPSAFFSLLFSSVLFLAITYNNYLLGNSPMQATHSILVETDAHEGLVYVPSQKRLYFTSVPDLEIENPQIAIRYYDFITGEVVTWKHRSNMANSMWLSNDGEHLLVAEQGKGATPGAISRRSLSGGQREVLVDAYKGKPFNSPNKVVQSPSGWIYFTDPDYGYNQGFKPEPMLTPAVYAFDPSTKKLIRLSAEYMMPHGLAISPIGNQIYIGDTAAIDGKNPYNPKKTKDIYVSALPSPEKLEEKQWVLSVPVGIPDGFIVTGPKNDLWVAAGDGLRHYRENGSLVNLYPVPGGVYSVATDGKAIYSSSNTAIWKTIPRGEEGG